MSNILLLRTPSESPLDPYDAAFRNALHNPYSVPVLQTSFTDLSKLQDLITAGPHSRAHAGVILTSKRSCEAWTTAVKNQITSSSDDETARSKLNLSLAAWTKTPFYVVGKGTAAALREFQTICLNLSIDFMLDIRGEGTGSGEQLAHFILEDLKHNDPEETTMLLYLTGDKNRDTVPKILSSDGAARIQLDALQVYKTYGASDFEDNLDAIIRETRQDSRNWWIAFFAPSSSTFVYPILQKYFYLRRRGRSSLTEEDRSPIVYVAAIGHTTSSFLEDQLDLHVDVVAAKPTPDALLAAIAAYPS